MTAMPLDKRKAPWVKSTKLDISDITIYEPLGLPGRSVDYDGKLIGNDMAYHVAAILMTFTDLGDNLSRLKLF